uniref:Uncharacterized protein n=1 Tax=Picea glauca TaxID=3330 RepID=A0A101LTQ5_PICGL|nr:hypothetical protein ABT39_MTgene3571 [Picea glauca]
MRVVDPSDPGCLPPSKFAYTYIPVELSCRSTFTIRDRLMVPMNVVLIIPHPYE